MGILATATPPKATPILWIEVWEVAKNFELPSGETVKSKDGSVNLSFFLNG